MAGGPDALDQAALRGGQGRLLHHLDQAQHRVERGADLVAHVGQEFALGGAGGLRLGGAGRHLGLQVGVEGADLRLDALDLGDLFDDAIDADDLAAGVAHRVEVLPPMAVDPGLGGGLAAQLDVQQGLAAVEDPLEQGFSLVRHIGHDLPHPPSQVGGDRQAVHLRQPVVEAQEAQVAIQDEEAHRGGGVDGLQLDPLPARPFLALAQPLFRFHLGGDVGVGAEHAQWLASGIALEHRAAVESPFPAAVLAAQAVDGRVTGRLARKMGLQGGLSRGQVVRMHATAPFRHVGADVRLVVAEHPYQGKG